MNIEKITDNKNTLKIDTKDDTQTIFSLLKTFLNENKDVEVSGVFKNHHLQDNTSFF